MTGKSPAISSASSTVWNKRVLIVFSIALVLRMAHFAMSSDNPLLYSPVLDEAYYISLGKAIAGGYLMGENGVFFMDPFYGYLLGLVFKVFGDNLTVVRLMQITLDSFNVVLLYMIGSRVWSRTAGLLAGIFYAGYKVSFFYSLLILKTTLTATGCLLFTLALIEASRRKSATAWAGMGAFAALLTYLRGNLLLLAPLGLLSYLVIEKPAVKEFVKNTTYFLLAMALILSGGAVRNYYASGQFVLLNTQTGRLLYASNNPENLTGRYNVPSFSRPNPEDSEKDFYTEAERRTGKKLNAKEVSAYWTRETMSFLLKNPSAAATLLYNKLKGTVGDYEIPNNHSFYLASRFSELARFPLPTFAFALAFGAPGLVVALLQRREAMWLLVTIITILATVLIFYTSSRFRFPMAPVLLIGAGIFFETVYTKVRERNKNAVVKAVTPAVIIFALSLSVPAPAGTGNEEYFLAKAYWRTGRLDTAWETASDAAEKFPGQARFHTLMGMTALSARKYGDAEKKLLAALKTNPGDADAYHNLGLVYLATKAPEKAVKAFEAALSAHPRPETVFALGRACEESGELKKAVEYYRKLVETLRPGEPMRRMAEERLSALGVNL